MHIHLTKIRLAVAIAAVVALVPATAVATHVFSDVDDSRFFADAVEWASDNGITTGTSPTTFDPDRGVTRGESVTFLRRYDTNVVQPALAGVTGDVVANTASIAALPPAITRLQYSGSNIDTSISGTWEYVRDLGTFTKTSSDTDVIINVDGHGEINAVFCHWQVRVDGLTDVGAASTSPSLADGGSAVQYATGAWFIQALFSGLGTGSHDVELWLRGSGTDCQNNPFNFGHTALVTELITQ